MRLSVPFSALSLTSALPTAPCLKDSMMEMLSEMPQGDQPPEGSVDNRPFINRERLQEMISEQSLRDWALKLWDHSHNAIPQFGHRTRFIGSVPHCQTLNMIVGALNEFQDYFDFTYQKFTAKSQDFHYYSVDTHTEKNLTSLPMRGSPSRSPVDAPVHKAKNFGCNLEDYETMRNHVVVVRRGGCTFSAKSEVAGKAGAVAVLVYDPALSADEAIVGHLEYESPFQVAILSISPNAAEKLTIGSRVVVQLSTTRHNINTYNIIAETKSGDHNNVIAIGAHTDSVKEGPGINDNGSGFILLMELAKQLSKFQLKNAVRLIFFSAEEENLQGSKHYVQQLSREENAKIRMYWNFDMIASPNYINGIFDGNDTSFPAGSRAMRDTLIHWYDTHGISYRLLPFDNRGDYVYFVRNNIPTGSLTTGYNLPKSQDEAKIFGGQAGEHYDKCYHKECDDINNLSYSAWMTSAKAIAYAVAKYAESLSDFPERES